ncbi:MAG: MerR family transcriptional regulator [Myxococcales bacterium]|nr:MerR family transcriptional regulator [Myxococcales bacterium]
MAAVTDYGFREVTQLLDLRPSTLRSWIRAGFLEPSRGANNELRFGFRDLVLLRTTKELVARDVPASRVKLVLARLKEQLPRGRPLTGVHIEIDGNKLLVQDGLLRWEPESGQTVFDFEVDLTDLSPRVEPLARLRNEASVEVEGQLGPDGWHELALTLEAISPDQARDAFRRALELDPASVEIRLDLSRLLFDIGLYEAAASHAAVAERVHPTIRSHRTRRVSRSRRSVGSRRRGVLSSAQRSSGRTFVQPTLRSPASSRC